MSTTKIITDALALRTEFSRCCNEYKTLDAAVAWCGKPKDIFPYRDIKRFGRNLKIVVGVGFNQTHPAAFPWLEEMGADFRIFRPMRTNLFHPKIYLFKSEKKFALFIGSSNLTYSGFTMNVEASLLMEGDRTQSDTGIAALERQLAEWRSDSLSFVPDDAWLKKYSEEYKQHPPRPDVDPAVAEDQISESDILSEAGWDDYRALIHDSLVQSGRSLEAYLMTLNAAEKNVPLPWHVEVFDDLNNRKIIGGMEPYGWLGHVAASGAVRGLLANGSLADHRTIVSAVNTIAALDINASDYEQVLERQLERLEQLGPTMKVWGRLLCLVRPDVYCTIASPSVRANMAKTLGVSQRSLTTRQGYIQLLRLLHASPWFNARRPADAQEAVIWDRRVALMDAIFYDPE